MSRIDKKARFRNDLLENFIYLGERNLDAAIHFLAAVQKDCTKLADMPGMGAQRQFRHRAVQNVRSWPVSGFELLDLLSSAARRH